MKLSYQGGMEKAAISGVRDIDASWKDCRETCYAIRGRKVDAALRYLDDVVAKRDFVPFHRHFRGKGHRTSGTPGGWPVKAVKIVKGLLENAKVNAENKKLDTEKLKVVHATAYKSMTIERMKPKGDAHPSNIDTASIEIVVKEV